MYGGGAIITVIEKWCGKELHVRERQKPNEDQLDKGNRKSSIDERDLEFETCLFSHLGTHSK